MELVETFERDTFEVGVGCDEVLLAVLLLEVLPLLLHLQLALRLLFSNLELQCGAFLRPLSGEFELALQIVHLGLVEQLIDGAFVLVEV